jgi:UDP-N-acetylglucosamine 1-carboxyvinyltransferase
MASDRVRKMRATFNVLGPLLARVGHAGVLARRMRHRRPVDLPQAFEAMGRTSSSSSAM